MSGARMACLGPGCKERAPADRRKPIEISDMAVSWPERSNMLHIRIVRTAGALGRNPGNVLIGVLDIASLAVDAVLRVDHIARLTPLLYPFIDAGRAIPG